MIVLLEEKGKMLLLLLIKSFSLALFYYGADSYEGNSDDKKNDDDFREEAAVFVYEIHATRFDGEESQQAKYAVPYSCAYEGEEWRKATVLDDSLGVCTPGIIWMTLMISLSPMRAGSLLTMTASTLWRPICGSLSSSLFVLEKTFAASRTSLSVSSSKSTTVDSLMLTVLSTVR